jgi:serine/threonine-protein kinase
MIGYMLTDKDDRRLNLPAPIAIVRDLREHAGSPEIVNGLSCIACHNTGLKRFKDQVRNRPAVFGAAKLKVDRLYGTPEKAEELVNADEAAFLKALDSAAGKFLRVGDDESRSMAEFEEPVASVAQHFQRDLTAATVAAELGMRDTEQLTALLRASTRMRELGLTPLLDAGGIKRALWEKEGVSLFHHINLELNNTPFEVF